MTWTEEARAPVRLHVEFGSRRRRARPTHGKTRRQGDSRDTEGEWNRRRLLAHEEVARSVGAPTLADDMETKVDLVVE